MIKSADQYSRFMKRCQLGVILFSVFFVPIKWSCLHAHVDFCDPRGVIDHFIDEARRDQEARERSQGLYQNGDHWSDVPFSNDEDRNDRRSEGTMSNESNKD